MLKSQSLIYDTMLTQFSEFRNKNEGKSMKKRKIYINFRKKITNFCDFLYIDFIEKERWNFTL